MFGESSMIHPRRDRPSRSATHPAQRSLPLSSSSSAPSPIPERIGAYRVKASLGRGGMGEVYLAYHQGLDREVAIKAILPEVMEDPELRRRLRKEARLTAKLNHPAVVQIYDLLELDEGDFIVMELVKGPSLQALAGSSMPPHRFLELGRQVTEGLDAAHALGIIHRDLKTENVMLDERGRAKILDFGLARNLRGDMDESPQATGMVFGTLRAMSPEQTRGQHMDARSDLFSFGVLLYELATGQSPFVGKGLADTLRRISVHQPEPIHELRPDLPEEVSKLVARLLEKDPEQRPKGAAEVGVEIRRLAEMFSDGVSDGAQSGPLALGTWDEAEKPPEESTEGHPVSLPPLPGRGSDLERLDLAWRGAREGVRKIVFVSGEAGIGKSSLVSRFVRQAGTDALGTEGRCLEFHGAGEAYLPILDALGRLCRGPQGRAVKQTLLQWAPSWLLQLPWVLDEGEREQVMRLALGAGPARMLREMVEALDALSRRRPLLLVIEDLHWSDLSTLDLLSAVARRPDPARLMIVATLRTSELADASQALPVVINDLRARGLAEEIHLDLLDPEAVAQILAQRLPGRRLSDELVREVHRQSGGNPLFTLHLAELLGKPRDEIEPIDDRPSLSGLPSAGPSGTGNPSSGGSPSGEWIEADEDHALLEQAAISRDLFQILDGLVRRASEEEQRLLELASIAGERFLLPVVAAAADQDPLDCQNRFDEMVDRGAFLRREKSRLLPNGRRVRVYAFLHDVYRQVLRRRLRADDRATAHLAIAETLEGAMAPHLDTVAAELAHHFEMGRNPSQAVRYSSLAAATALRRSAYREAIGHLRRAQELIEPLEKPAGENDPALEAQHLGLLRGLGIALIGTRGFSDPEAGEVFHRAETLARALGDQRQHFFALTGCWVYHWMRAEIPLAQDLGAQAVALASAPDGNRDRSYDQLVAHAILGAALLRRGDFAAAVEAFERSLEFEEQIGFGAHFDSFPLVEGRVFSRVFGSLGLWNLGRIDEARDWALEACRLAMDIGHPFSQLNASSVAATLFLLCGDVSRARELHRRAEAIKNEHGFPLSLAPTLRSVLFEADTELADAKLSAIEAEMEQARASGAILLQNVDLLMLALARLRVGRHAEALEATRQGQEIAEVSRDRWYLPELLRLEAEMLLGAPKRASAGDDGQAASEIAEGRLRRALEIAIAQGSHSWQLRCATTLARLLGEQQRTVEAIELMAPRVESGDDDGVDLGADPTADHTTARALLESLRSDAAK